MQYTFINQFMFALVMQDEEICKGVIERILPEKKNPKHPFPDETYLETEKTIIPSLTAKTVRLDVLFEDEDAWYDIEMQAATAVSLPKRCRYYHGAMDINHLHRGEHYDKLKPAYVIFICPFDYFNVNEPVLIFQSIGNAAANKNLCLPLGDESYTIIVNTMCSKEKVPAELRPLFNYINTQSVIKGEDSLIDKIDERVANHNIQKEVSQVMTLEEEYRFRIMAAEENAKKEGMEKGLAEGKMKGLSEGLAEGRAEGLAEGRAEGLVEGRIEAITETACKMKAAGLPTETISECTGLSPEEINKL